MCDKYRRDQRLALDAADLLTRLQAETGVQIRERLVQKKDTGTLDQGAGDRHTLLLTAGKLARLALHELIDLNDLGSLEGFRFHFLLGQLVLSLQIAQREHDILLDRQVRIQRVILEDQAYAPALGREVRHIRLAEENLSVRRFLQSADQIQRGALAAA